MDDRAIRRLLFIFLASLVAIILFKYGMTKTYVNLNKAAAEKKRAADVKKPVAQQTQEQQINAVTPSSSTPAETNATTTTEAPAVIRNSEAH